MTLGWQGLTESQSWEDPRDYQLNLFFKSKKLVTMTISQQGIINEYNKESHMVLHM